VRSPLWASAGKLGTAVEHRGEASSARDLGTTCRGGSAGCTAGELTGGAADGAVVQGGERVSSARGGRKGPRPGGDVGDNPPRAGVGEWKRPRRTRWNAGVLARMRQAVCGGVGRQLLSAPVVMRGGEVVRPLVAGGRWTQGVRVGRAQSLRRVAGQPRMLAEEDEARGRARGAIATAQLLAPRSHPCAAVFAGSRPSLSLADCVERVHGQAGARVAHACCPRRDTAAPLATAPFCLSRSDTMVKTLATLRKLDAVRARLRLSPPTAFSSWPSSRSGLLPLRPGAPLPTFATLSNGERASRSRGSSGNVTKSGAQ